MGRSEKGVVVIVGSEFVGCVFGAFVYTVFRNGNFDIVLNVCELNGKNQSNKAPFSEDTGIWPERLIYKMSNLSCVTCISP